ncbi:MAG: strF [Frankiales bacterium]|nr:strF [Frankiales bacterium]
MVFAVGVCIGNERKYSEVAALGLKEHAERDTVVLERREQPSIFAAYNSLLQEAQTIPDLEGLVLLHEDVLVRDRDWLNKLRAAFTDPEVGVVGVYGCRRPESLAWHTQASARGYVEETRFVIDKGRSREDVDVLDGLFLALSPRVVRDLTFDEHRFQGWHGYDADICLQARALGLRAMTEFVDLLHDAKGGYGDRVQFLRTDLLFRQKWRGSPFVSPHMKSWDTSTLGRTIALGSIPVRAAAAEKADLWGPRLRRRARALKERVKR